MDETGLYLSFMVLGIVLAVLAAMAWYWRRETRKGEIAQSWPITEATVESGTLEAVTDSSAKAPIILPVFAFSYQVAGKYHSGRFSLSHLKTNANDLIQRMLGHRLQVRYDPSSPDVWFIPDAQIEGCRVEQKRGPHVVALYPRD